MELAMRFLTGRRAFCTLLTAVLAAPEALGDGKVFNPRSYNGSLEERSQEAIIIFRASEEEGGSFEDLILKIDVRGRTDKFAWVVPFPKEPVIAKEDARLFRQLHNYVEMRLARRRKKAEGAKGLDEPKDIRRVDVLSRQVVGSYDVAVVRENEAGALNEWLKAEGYQTLPPDSEDVMGFYRRKGYVFACVKVKDAAPGKDDTAALHPLRFSFQTGGYDAIYFPMKMTGLQTEPFDVNLYVFYRYWINDDLSKHGYVHRGFSLRYRDWDSPQCEPNAGKSYSAPKEDPFLRLSGWDGPEVTALFQKLHPGERFYLTNIQAYDLEPAEVRRWADDLWLFPYNDTPGWVPHDARKGGIASATYEEAAPVRGPIMELGTAFWSGVGLAILAIAATGAWLWWRNRGYAGE
jgi:hypothetical protein